MLPLPERDAGKRQAGQRRRHAQGQEFTDAGPPGRPVRSFPGECPADAKGREELEHDGAAGERSPRSVVREGQRGEDGERREGERGKARVRGQRRHARPDKDRRGELLHHEGQQEGGEHRNESKPPPVTAATTAGTASVAAMRAARTKCRRRGSAGGRERTAQNSATSSRNPAGVQPPARPPKAAASSKGSHGGPFRHPAQADGEGQAGEQRQQQRHPHRDPDALGRRRQGTGWPHPTAGSGAVAGRRCRGRPPAGGRPIPAVRPEPPPARTPAARTGGLPARWPVRSAHGRLSLAAQAPAAAATVRLTRPP